MNIFENVGPRLLLSLRQNNLTWNNALCELVDNSFDANAARVEINFSKSKTLEIIDDGSGCDDLLRMLTLGDHYRKRSTKLGRFGVGLKEAACWLWGDCRIDTVSRGIRRRCQIDWANMVKKDNPNVADPIESEAKEGETGTHIRFRKYQKTNPDYDNLCRELGYIFWPALKSGRQIVTSTTRRKPRIVSAWEMPPIGDIIRDKFSVNGKSVKLFVGIVKEGEENTRNGFSWCFGHRVICNNSLGARSLSTARVCGIIELGKRWELSKNKTELVDCNQDELEWEIYDRCKELLEKSSEQAEAIRNRELESEVSSDLRSMLSAQSKAKRNKRSNRSGAVEPEDSKRRHRRASKSQRGDRFLARCRLGYIRMEWKEEPDGKLGSVDLMGDVIYINPNHPRLSLHKRMGNAPAIADICMALMAYEVSETIDRGKFNGMKEYDDFNDALSSYLGGQETSEVSETIGA